jgi:flagellar basal body P-ring formation protein FlgA
MRHKGSKIIVAVLLLCCGRVSGAQNAGLHVHMPRTVRLEGKDIRLGALAIVRGPDEKLVAKASKIAMGRLPWSQEKMVIDRRTILSRLAANGIKGANVRLTGAEKVIVTRRDVVFSADKLVKVAEAFIKKTCPVPGQCQWRLLRKPEVLLVPEGGEIKLLPRLAGKLQGGYVCVEVVALNDKREIGVARIPFKQLYRMRQLVAVRSIPSGGIITSDNTKITLISVANKPPEWRSPYGMACIQAVRAGDVIRPSLWKAKKPIVVIKKNGAVQMKIQMTGFIIVTNGQALQDGRIGDVIRVRNVDSKRIVMASVAPDGTVTPLYNKR